MSRYLRRLWFWLTRHRCEFKHVGLRDGEYVSQCRCGKIGPVFLWEDYE